MKLLSFNFFDQNQTRLFKEIEEVLVSDHPTSGKQLLTIATPNPEQIVLSQTDKQFADDLQSFDYLLPDGVGLVWASWIFKFFGKTHTHLKERIPGVDVVTKLLHMSEADKLKVLVVGGRSYQDLGHLLSDKLGLADLKIKWTEGFKDVKHQSQAEQQTVIDLVKKLHPDVILVAFGAPDQERWIINNQQFLASQGVRLAMAIGGSLEMLTGRLQRAPGWMRRIGLEWLWRLIQEPWRWRRQLALVKFAWLVAKLV